MLKQMVVRVSNYALMPSFYKKIDVSAGIRDDMPTLTRARLRIMWIAWNAAKHFRQVFVDRQSSTADEWLELETSQKAVASVDKLSGNIMFSYEN